MADENSTVEIEQYILQLTKEHNMPEERLHPILDGLRNIAPHYRYGALGTAHDEVALLQAQRENPLRLGDFASISVRQAVGGQHFVKKIEQFHLPSKMKSYQKADFTAHITKRVFHYKIVH